MRSKSTIATALLSACLLALLLAPRQVAADEIQLQDNRPDRYTVQKGDTLWGIAGKFLKQPWRWPEIWRMNRDQIKNPHWIYPGDVIALDRVDGGWRLRIAEKTIRVSPTVRVESLEGEAIPSIPAGDLAAYITQPIVTGPDGLSGAAKIIAARDSRVVRGEGDSVYAIGVEEGFGTEWVIYRPGNLLRSYDSGEVLGWEMRYLGTARVERFAEVSRMLITAAREEILINDLLIPAPRRTAQLRATLSRRCGRRPGHRAIQRRQRGRPRIHRGARSRRQRRARGRQCARDSPPDAGHPRSSSVRGPGHHFKARRPDQDHHPAWTVPQRSAGAHRSAVRLQGLRPGVLCGGAQYRGTG